MPLIYPIPPARRPRRRQPQMEGPLDWITTAAKAVEHGVEAGAKGVVTGAKAVGSGIVKAGKTTLHVVEWPFSKAKGIPVDFLKDIDPRDKGWVTRFGSRMALLALTPIAPPLIICQLPKYSHSAICVGAGKLVWTAQKEIIEKGCGLPPGTLDALETILNATGKDRAARERAAQKFAKDRNLPIEALMPSVVRIEPPSWWDQLLSWLGLR